MRQSLSQLRWMSLIDAISYVLLVGIAMPLKHFADIPQPVSVVGMLHGIIWMLLVVSLVRARFASDWSTKRLLLIGFAALVPIVPFFLDRSIREWIEVSCTASS